jgi:hypothetical protein
MPPAPLKTTSTILSLFYFYVLSIYTLFASAHIWVCALLIFSCLILFSKSYSLRNLNYNIFLKRWASWGWAVYFFKKSIWELFYSFFYPWPNYWTDWTWQAVRQKVILFVFIGSFKWCCHISQSYTYTLFYANPKTC